jgi:hypothetical protein
VTVVPVVLQGQREFRDPPTPTIIGRNANVVVVVAITTTTTIRSVDASIVDVDVVPGSSIIPEAAMTILVVIDRVVIVVLEFAVDVIFVVRVFGAPVASPVIYRRTARGRGSVVRGHGRVNDKR